METIGWLGAFFFAICGVPQAWKSYTDKNSNGISWLFIIFWLLGEVLTLIYVWETGMLPLIVNYLFNLASLVVIIYYKIITSQTHRNITDNYII